ncbi:hypothetical protein [Paenibacillus polymyxa]|uniref:hypothetical protein n=1 Tax=Paenibacillus polymyxa TaxID=1406 RepID=UPI0002F2238B|nr:hypothetical protein [Paenibacillus polymyxa]
MATARYRSFVENIQKNIGRELNGQELHSVIWLSGMDKITEDHFMKFIVEAFENGKVSK